MIPQDNDLLAPEGLDTPHEAFAQLRRDCPVAHGNAFGGFWMLIRYDDIVCVLGDPIEFTPSFRIVVPRTAATRFGPMAPIRQRRPQVD